MERTRRVAERLMLVDLLLLLSCFVGSVMFNGKPPYAKEDYQDRLNSDKVFRGEKPVQCCPDANADKAADKCAWGNKQVDDAHRDWPW